MRARKRPDLDDVHVRFEAWRAGASGRCAIPESLLRAAIALQDCRTPSTIRRRLRLNAARLGRARQALEGTRTKAAVVRCAIVELPALGVATTTWQAPLMRRDAPGQGVHLRHSPAPRDTSVELARVDEASLELACRSLLAASAGPASTAPSVPQAGAGMARSSSLCRT